MPAPFFPNSACIDQAAALQALLAASVVKLFQFGVISVTPATTVTELDAAECDFDDYAPETITAWGDPITSVLGGAQITAPGVQFTQVAEPSTPNAAGGYWIEDAAGNVVLIRAFDDAVSFAAANSGVVIVPTIVIPNGQ